MLQKLQQSSLYPLILSIVSGVLLWLAWPTSPLVIFVFLGFVPLLEVERWLRQHRTKRVGWRFFGYVYLAMIIWNIGTTWWVYNSTAEGGIAAVISNSLLMTVPWALYSKTRLVIGSKGGYIGLAMYWVAFEYVHLNWELSWPWLSLGNVFAAAPNMVQWYEYTGILGGSLWILAVNTFLHYKLTTPREKRLKYFRWVPFFLLVTIPLIISWSIDPDVSRYEKKPVEIIAVQPNENPVTGAVDFTKYKHSLDALIKLSEEAITDSTTFVLWPESAIGGRIEENELMKAWAMLGPNAEISDSALYTKYVRYNVSMFMVHAFVGRHPHITLIAGVSSRREATENDPAASYHKALGYYYPYNSAMVFSAGKNPVVYHKSRLVIGVEKIPYPLFFNWIISKLDIEDAANLGTQDERTLLYDKDSLVAIAPAICYESVYGDFLTDYLAHNGELIAVITNDGWWHDTDGHRQHALYGQLRAIEFRKWVARAANNGTSCFIDPSGKTHDATDYWTDDVIRRTVEPNTYVSFYALHGDYLGRVAVFLAIALLLSVVVKRKTKR